MKTLQLPGTDLTVSQLCFGCWGITSDFHWGERDENLAIATIEAAIDAGVQFFDTAAAYGDGASETLLGKLFAGRRDKVVLASKVRADRMRPEQVIENCEESLRRLQTDYLDLYQTHWTSPDTPLEESWGALLRLQEQGKIRHAGCCNLGIHDIQSVASIGKPVTNQLPYNLLWRAIEHEILPACREQGIGVLVYSPLMHGLLADKYRSASEVPDGRARSRHFTTQRPLARHGEPGCESETFAAIDAIREICSQLHRTMADVALAWVAGQPGVDCAIVGASSPEQLTQNLETLANPLEQEVVERLNQVTQSLSETLGANPDMWDGGQKARFR